MRVMVFLHGTTIMHRNAVGHTPREISQQVRDQEESVHDYASYVPVGNAVFKLRTWSDQGAEIVYLTSHRNTQGVQNDREVLRRHRFPDGPILMRRDQEEYRDVAQRVLPDVLIEDDCASIGGELQMTYPHISRDIRCRIRSIVVKEFSGIDHLPDTLSELRGFQNDEGDTKESP
jgi:hypothetical protein